MKFGQLSVACRLASSDLPRSSGRTQAFDPGGRNRAGAALWLSLRRGPTHDRLPRRSCSADEQASRPTRTDLSLGTTKRSLGRPAARSRVRRESRCHPWATAAEENIALIRRLDAFSRGDFGVAVEDMQPDVEWHLAFRLPDLPLDKTIFRGPDEVRWLWGAFRSAWEQLTVSLEEVVDAREDVVVVRARFVGRGAAAGSRWTAPSSMSSRSLLAS